ncbi:MAG: DHH family phosphoesterase [Candidatus Thermoplasmatota archaeon]
MDALLARLASAGDNVLWLLHVNADPDCVGSAFALKTAFGGEVGAPEGLSKSGAALARRLSFVVDEWPHPENFSMVVAVDTSSRSQLGRMGGRVGDVCLVDHHAYGDLLANAPAVAHDPTRSSCCEVALALLDHASKPLTPDAAFALLAGLVDDSARFRHAGARTFHDAARLLLLSGAKMEDVLATLAGDDEPGTDDPSLRKATLLAATRARIEVIGVALVATSEVGAFDAAAASALVRAGADLAIVSSERSDRARMSLRAHPRVKLHLGEIANEAARATSGWSGGGHEGAAGMSGPPPAGPARSALVALVRAKLGVR